MRIKINTNDDTADKLIAVSFQLSALRKLKSRFLKLTANSYKLTATKGFTLVELLVTLSLFVILTTIVLFNSSKFNGSVLLTNLAYDVAITIRQAQTFGVSVRESSSGNFQSAYGVHFDISKPSQFILFADTDLGDKKFGSGDSIVDTYNIKRGNKISKICAVSSFSPSCADTPILDIAFIRPNQDAIINSDPDAIEARIVISSADGASSRIIVVNSTGQISIEK